MRYIRVRESTEPIVASSYRIAPGLAVLVVTFAPGCVPSADLSSYSSAASSAAADLGGGRTPAPSRSFDARGSGSERATADTSGESIPGSGALLDPSGASQAPSSSSGGDDESSVEPARAESDAGAGMDASAMPLPADSEPPDATPPRPFLCSLDEATGPNGHCYALVATPLDWDTARSNCRGRGPGWDLASIRSSSDSAFVLGLLDGEAWVGASDGESEATWAWVGDGLDFWQGEGEDGRASNGAFVNWFEDEPNGSTSSQCMRLLVDSRWADLECTELRSSICEGPGL